MPRSQKWSDLLILACKVSFLYNEGLHVRIWGYIDRFLSGFFFTAYLNPIKKDFTEKLIKI